MKKQNLSKTFLLIALFLAGSVQAAYVSERLYLGIYALPESTATPVKMLPSGSEVQILEEQGDFVRIKMEDGSEGWARAEFISENEPAGQTIKQVTRQRDQLQAQLNAMGATEQTVTRLQRQLAEANEKIKTLQRDMEGGQADAASQLLQEKAQQAAQLNELRKKLATAEEQATAQQEEVKALKTKLRYSGGSTEAALAKIAWVLVSMLLCLVIGAALGAKWLARRVRKRFNGLKVW